MMGSSRILAVDHVHLSCPADRADAMVWFYADVARLDRGEPGEGPFDLCFRSAQVEVRIRLDDDHRADSVPLRLTVAVPSLAEAAAILEERRCPHTWIRGLAYTDRRVEVLDPAGHRVALRQALPTAVMQGILCRWSGLPRGRAGNPKKGG